MSPRSRTVGPGPLQRTPATPWPPILVWTSYPRAVRWSAAFLAVCSSSPDSSGLAWRCW
jgi:hypothetical protein